MFVIVMSKERRRCDLPHHDQISVENKEICMLHVCKIAIPHYRGFFLSQLCHTIAGCTACSACKKFSAFCVGVELHRRN